MSRGVGRCRRGPRVLQSGAVHGPIANHQNGIGFGAAIIAADRQRHVFGAELKATLQQKLRQGNAGPGAFVQGDRADLAERSAAEQLDAPNRSAATDAGIRDNGVVITQCDLDHRDQGDVQQAGRQLISQPAGEIQPQFIPGR